MNKAVRNVAPIKNVGDDRISVILLSAGEGVKMRSYGPRPLLQITEKHNLISYQYSLLTKVFNDPQIIMVCGHEANTVMNHAPKDIIKVENEKYNESNVVRSLGIGLRAATYNRVLVVYGDLLFNIETVKHLKLQESSLVIDNSGLFDTDEIGCTINDKGYAEQLFYELPNKWAQILFLSGLELDLMKKIAWHPDHTNWFGFEAVNSIIEKGGNFYCDSPKKMKIIDIDSTKNLQEISLVI